MLSKINRLIIRHAFFATAVLGCKHNNAASQESAIKSDNKAKRSVQNQKLMLKRSVHQTLRSVGLEHIWTEKADADEYGRIFRMTAFHYSGNIISNKTGNCLGVKADTAFLKVTNSSDVNDVINCPSVFLYGKQDMVGKGWAPDHRVNRIIFSQNGDARCLQMNGHGKPATLELCLANDPNNIQTFDWDTGEGWGLIRQAGDKSKALCLDIENQDRYDKINFFNCAVTGIVGQGNHQRFWFRYYSFFTENKVTSNGNFESRYYNQITLVD